MKIAVPLDENKRDVCPAFARAPYFMVSTGDSSEVKDNPAAQAQGGAGLKAAQFILDIGADTLITPRCGDNAAEAFKAAGMKIYKSGEGTAEDNVKACMDGRLEELTHFHPGYHGRK